MKLTQTMSLLRMTHRLRGTPTQLDEQGYPKSSGVYLVKNRPSDPYEDWYEIDVYEHPQKGLCVWGPDYGGENTSANDETEGHASVRTCGLTFIRKVR